VGRPGSGVQVSAIFQSLLLYAVTVPNASRNVFWVLLCFHAFLTSPGEQLTLLTIARHLYDSEVDLET